LDGVREIKAGGGKRTKVKPRSQVERVRLSSGLSQAQFAAALGVSKRTLEQWEQGRRQPSGAAKTLLLIAERHPEVLIEVAA
jgi:putative transcriptional regulator